MATLVLSAVGTAVGGPVGGAVGALVGQVIDREILFRPKRREGPRLTDLQLQTSGYGVAVPRVYGTMRVAGNVIWATELRETRGRSGGGKGQASATTYSYSASFAVALSTRAIARIGRIWADGKLLRDEAGVWKSATIFRWYPGDERQRVDPLMASLEGEAIPAHRGIAYAVFEDLALGDFGNRIPSLSFEIVADDAPSIASIIADVAGDVVSATGERTVAGFAATGDARTTLDLMATAGGGVISPSTDGRSIYREALPRPIEIDDEGVDGPRGIRSIRAADQAPGAVAIGHYDPARDWQVGLQQARRQTAGSRERRIDLPVAVVAEEAKAIAWTMLATLDRERTTRRLRLDSDVFGLRPGMSVTVKGDRRLWRVQKVAIEAMVTVLDVVAAGEPRLVTASDSGRRLAAPDLSRGTTIAHAVELPPIDDAMLSSPRIVVMAAGTGSAWRRGEVVFSRDDGTSWETAGSIPAPAVIGTIIEAAAPGPATLRDEHDTLTVELAHPAMTLEPASAMMIDRGGNLAIAGGELIQFARVEQIASTRWRLSGMVRAIGAMAGPMAVGDRFVLVDRSALLAIDLPGAIPGETVQLRVTAAGDTLASEIAVPVTGRSILPPAPVAARVVPTSDGSLALSWTRRARLAGRWSDLIDVPLIEESERYQVMITTSAGIRTMMTNEPSIVVSSAEWPAAIEVRQLGTYGASAALSFSA